MIHRSVVHGTIFYLFPSLALYHISEQHEHRWKRKLKVTVQAKTVTVGGKGMPE
jgi:hypothetical protein